MRKGTKNMKNKVIYKILFIFLILFCVSTVVAYAADYGSVNQFDPYTPKGTGFEIVDNTVNRTAEVILDIVRIVAFCIGLLLLIIIGIKYIIATPEMRAELKKDVPTYFIGAVILFATSGILQFVTSFVHDVF